MTKLYVTIEAATGREIGLASESEAISYEHQPCVAHGSHCPHSCNIRVAFRRPVTLANGTLVDVRNVYSDEERRLHEMQATHSVWWA